MTQFESEFIKAKMLTIDPWAHIPKHYAGRWAFDYDEKNHTFFVCCGGHRILDAEDSEVCDAVCRAHNAQC
jgi:hypothetical protein